MTEDKFNAKNMPNNSSTTQSSSNEINISYPFSPPIASTQFPPAILKKILAFCDPVWDKEMSCGEKTPDLIYGNQLVGRNFSEIDIRTILDESGATSGIAQMASHFLNSTQILLSAKNPITIRDIKFVGGWANLTLPNYDYNPIHMHPDCILTTVGYLEVPDWEKMKADNRNDKVTKPHLKEGQPGSLVILPDITATHSPFVPHAMNIVPEVGKYYMFPGNVKHTVYPYPDGYGLRKSFVVNISLSKDGFTKTTIPQFCKATAFGYFD
jgi:hypothetical protein